MADIFPINTTLNTLSEGAYVSQQFTPILDSNEELVSINIINHQPTPGIEVVGSLYQGNYESVFEYGSDALSYRLGDEFKIASTWEDLPTSVNTQLYLWRAPQVLDRTFTYTVLMKYTVTTTSGSGGSGKATDDVVTEKQITKVYSQRIVWNWSNWANKLRNYVYGRE